MIETGVNSYITVSEAEALLQGDRQRESFAALTNSQKEQLLINAAMRVDSLPYAGRKKNSSQLMEFPRDNMSEVPYRVRLAQAAEAVCVLDKEAESRRELADQGVTSVTVGKVSESYGDTNNRSWDRIGLKSRAAYYLLRSYLAGSVPIV